MTRGRGRGSKKELPQGASPEVPNSDKDRRRSAMHGRAAQGLGSGGRSGGTKSSGGRAKGGSHGGYRGGSRGGGSGR